MLWVLASAVIFLLAVVGFLVLRQGRLRYQAQHTQQSENAFLLMQQQLDGMRGQLTDLTGQLNDRLKDNNHLMHQSQQQISHRLDNAAKVVGEVQSKLGQLEEANQKVYEVGKDIRSLQEILQTPKLRGSLGEFLLSDLLSQILPPEHYSLQHCFQNNEKVDAAIKIGESWVSVDAKFPLENFKRVLAAPDENEKKAMRRQFVVDVRRHIDAIASKYIRSDEGTFDFALMYIPAENVYYEVIVKDELTGGDHALASYAMRKKVIPVSPNTLYVYLQTIILGLRGLKIEKVTKTLLNDLSRLARDMDKIVDANRRVGLHLNNAQSAHEDTQGRLAKFNNRMDRLQAPVEAGQLDVVSEDPEIPASVDKVAYL